MLKSAENKLSLLGTVIYIIFAVFLCLFFIASDDDAPRDNFLALENLITLLIYVAVPLWLCYFLFLVFKTKLNHIIAFCISILIGIPGGIILDMALIQMIFN